MGKKIRWLEIFSFCLLNTLVDKVTWWISLSENWEGQLALAIPEPCSQYALIYVKLHRIATWTCLTLKCFLRFPMTSNMHYWYNYIFEMISPTTYFNTFRTYVCTINLLHNVKHFANTFFMQSYLSICCMSICVPLGFTHQFIFKIKDFSRKSVWKCVI